jgi:hypothetical protein
MLDVGDRPLSNAFPADSIDFICFFKFLTPEPNVLYADNYHGRQFSPI